MTFTAHVTTFGAQNWKVHDSVVLHSLTHLDLIDMVVSRGAKSGNVVVIRPDSGDPATVVCKLLNILGDKFGTSTNDKGFKVLPPYLRILQGDGIGQCGFDATGPL